jgi:hypothetical protein
MTFVGVGVGVGVDVGCKHIHHSGSQDPSHACMHSLYSFHIPIVLFFQSSFSILSKKKDVVILGLKIIKKKEEKKKNHKKYRIFFVLVFHRAIPSVSSNIKKRLFFLQFFAATT